MDKLLNQRLAKIYYNPKNPASYGGVERLFREAQRKKLSISRAQVQDWLAAQESYTILKPVIRRFARNKVLSYHPNDLWQSDLLDIHNLASYNDNMNFLLVVIDCFTRRAFVIPLRDKSANSVANGLKIIFRQAKTVPQFLQTDQGREYVNIQVQTLLKQRGISHYWTHNSEIKAALAERFNRTLRGKIARYLISHNTQRYIDALPSLIDGYNRSWHRSIQMRPIDIKTKKHEQQVFKNVYGIPNGKKEKTRFRLGETVRITIPPHIFLRGSFQKQWTSEVFFIDEIVRKTNQERPLYKLVDGNNEPIQGHLYANELQRVRGIKAQHVGSEIIHA